jgi:hypothetical protein
VSVVQTGAVALLGYLHKSTTGTGEGLPMTANYCDREDLPPHILYNVHHADPWRCSEWMSEGVRSEK